ncbi:hypothetical protein M9H77_11768 [Catharanthus roseus]|uniref:Uncharacterized protein n=1 Tax=Catharanthus roseus TaxID=4058 RepID=A0ACC0BFG1_CATRO|nr:hypothetical protein M9H77_11768 [Catharanthus roseus]
MNFGFMAIEHMLATQSSSTKCLPYGCFITKIFQYFVINLVGVGDHISPGKIYNQNTFKRMGFERNDEGLLIKSGQQRSDDNDEEDNSDAEEGEPEIDTAQIMDRIAAMQAQLNDQLDDLNKKIVDIQNQVIRLERGGKDTNEDEDD